ncbi:MAG: flagellar biosynthesis anti-sigma factor FlgM [Phycisphaerae bacterium]|nr:flagellar biosynthesis anti-sigma factor FlgM [Phycisphaerae bacterium]
MPNIERFRRPISGHGAGEEDQLDSAGSTPLGQLLKVISGLPEIRRDKVDQVRRQIGDGRYDVNDNLDAALDKVLEEFLADD